MPIINSTFTSKVRNPGKDTLLEYLARRFSYHSREKWAEMITLGRMELEGKTAEPEDVLREGMNLLFHVVDYHEPEVPLDWHVLPMQCEGAPPDDLMFVHKPAGMPVHRTGRIFFNTLANLVKEKKGPEWAPLHRLDRETSGIVAFARGAEALQSYSPSNPRTRWAKVYLGVVKGELPDFEVGRIDQPLGEMPGDEIRSRMHVRADGKNAFSLYQKVASGNGFSWVLLSPITGRKHQLRAHMAWLGYPIEGDKIYQDGGKQYLERLGLDPGLESTDRSRHLLHSMWLSISPPGRNRIECDDRDHGLMWSGGRVPDAVSGWKRSHGSFLDGISSALAF